MTGTTPSRAFTVTALSTSDRGRELTIQLTVPTSGKLKLSVTVGKRTLITESARITQSARTRTAHLTLRLAPKGLRQAHGSETLRVRITFTSAAGTVRTETRTIVLAGSVK